MNRRRKITLEQQAELVELYRNKGLAASAELCRKYGVNPKYAAGIAASMGRPRPKWRKGNRYKTNIEMTPDTPVRKRSDASRRRFDDPRWAKAIERGSVEA